ncbi:hypothetical protein BDN70DRAFT_616033 [Pholiota conissans]|uniref:GATA-type domain-containing protein n=1 Tax=Pholiota conissans TaxID=109636 RepID=A0A9P6CV68_9AGAR|nr:hypothetical protein BDN70DRAFT_616033 [Pholiota conissans]
MSIRTAQSSPRRFDRSPPPAAPPITTLTQPADHSPSPSVVSQDRSSNSTPHNNSTLRRSPPSMAPPPTVYYHHPHDGQQMMASSPAVRQSAHFSSRPEAINAHPYPLYAPQHPFDQHRYEHHPQDRHPHPHPYAVPSGMPAHFPLQQVPPQMHDAYGRQQYPSATGGPPPVTIVHTDDASTKLTDGIRRRCFNCCTTDTSTWRRSNLSPGKVLCNKCGLFERTHSRPRPDQFPHKRGPLATSTLRGRTPPGLSSHPSSHHGYGVHNGSSTLPPISVGSSGGGGYQYHHTNLTPLQHEYPANSGPPGQQAQLPGLGSWHGGNTSSSSSSQGGGPQQQQQQDGGGPGQGPNTNGSNSASNSAHGTPQMSRRSTIDASPRMQPSSSNNSNSSASTQQQSSNGNAASGSNSSNARRYDDSLSSNGAVTKHEDGAASPPGSRGSGSVHGGSGTNGALQMKTEAGTPERDV